ncbi:regulator of chromosome condensation 1/beta-lactamase-inhibitor protein II [Mycotypha africana]|uniref:regulator of chromosome condensation 1/beta-lactamase-inhibitor protein II n=1 Tax=Mycotypha africana TaxID=64632 RepID=UPI0023006A2C|nr:regulator of chromosome condensation 1/beta-lactamase-inhibitor protein II [Mycotypha africana]KAI8970411.1 regulator of chromosome condensation 1/beta-lactamase-inhibitor protein II [Mycotypha africana]
MSFSFFNKVWASNESKPPGGTLFVVGDGEVYGEIGLGDMPHVYDPTIVFDMEYESVIDISSSRLHTLAVTRSGTIWSWGCDDYGALGRTGYAASPRPITHPSIRYIRFKKVACGNSMSMAINSKGQLYTWGSFHSDHGIFGYLPNIVIQKYPRIVNSVADLRFIEIAAGASHCLALDDQGQVYSWGCGEFGHLGRPDLQNNENRRLKQCLIPVRLDGLKDIVAIACGAFHSLALDKDGHLYSWGLNHFQQCGLLEKIDDGNINFKQANEVIDRPTMVPYFCEQNAELKRNNDGLSSTRTKMAQNGPRTERFSENNSKNDKEQLTDNYDKPKALLIAAGDYHSVAAMSDNTLRVWGRCDNGQLGIIIYPDYVYPASFKTPEVDRIYAIGYPTSNLWRCSEKIEKIICGAEHTLIMSKYGRVWGYGQNASNQLGLFHCRENVAIPTLLNPINNKGAVVNIAAGDQCSMFVIIEDDKQFVKVEEMC